MLETKGAARWGRPGEGPDMFRRILLAVDGRGSDEAATSFVTAMAHQSAAIVRVVYVNEYLVGGRGFTRSTPQEARSIVDDATRSLVVAGIPAEGEVRLAHSFDMPSRIAEAASEWSADIIVLGSRRRRRLGRLFGQGMREKVTALTTLPTLTVPAPLRLDRDLDGLEIPSVVPAETLTDGGSSGPERLTPGAPRPSRSAQRGTAR